MIPAGCVLACPGCKHREFSAEQSLAQKQAWVEKKLGAALPIHSPTERWGYRRKSTLHARRGAQGWEFGLLRRKGREEIFVAIPDCPVHTPSLNAIFAECRSLPANLPLAFVQVSGRALTLVLKSAREEKWLKAVRAHASSAEAVFVNWHAAAGRRVLSSRHMEKVRGPDSLRDGEFLHGPSAFRQQIPELEERAHHLADEFLAGLPRILDLYCGLGVTLARWRKRGAEVLGVELGGEACELAERNAPGARVLKGKVEDRMAQIALSPEWGVYTNPPREGQGAEVCDWLEKSGVQRIAYLSCNMRSLREDLARLPSFTVRKVQPLDFFPQTDHVEALVLLERSLAAP